MKLTLTSLTLLLFTTIGHSQTLVIDKVDEFTEDVIKQTSWEPLVLSWDFNAYFSVSKINGREYLKLRIMQQGGKVFAIDEKDRLMIKMTDGKVVTLYNNKYQITCKGYGAIGFVGSEAHGIEVNYPLDNDQIITLMNGEIEKIRIYTTDTYLEKPTKSKHTNKFALAFNLLN